MSIKLAINGAAGRMGRHILNLCLPDRDVKVVAALEQAGHPQLGRDPGELAGIGSLSLPITEQAQVEFDVLIDFSLPVGTMSALSECARRTRPIVIGTTGHNHVDLERIREAARLIPVVKAANMSVGVNVLLRVAEQLGGTLDPSYDVEIVEGHHRFKADAPSGTAIALCEAVCRGREKSGAAKPSVIYGRHGTTGVRVPGEIGMHSLRLGDTIGEHTVSFGTLGETVTIGHSAHSRETFAAGAIRAAKWIVNKPSGLYDMQDVLFGTK